MARYFAPFLFLSLGSALLLPQLGLCVATMAHSVCEENFAPSLSTPILTYENEVFISFHAEDTRTRFTGHLFAALERKRIRVSELMKAIETSRIAVVVFSKNYATSNWCLDGLVKIMEYRRVLNQTVLPIFYGVSPSYVRKHMGNLAEAILNGPEDKVNIWKATLKDVANISGFHLKPDRYECRTSRALSGSLCVWINL
nr:TMV resistance protein N-like [Quercus suber]